MFCFLISFDLEHLTHAIVLDTDLTFVSDIGELWSWFTQMKNESFGLVENQSNWYFPNLIISNPWPALGRGFNTGVMLMNLEKLRELNWLNMWKMVAEKELLTYYKTTLADQDIINAVIKHYPHLVYKVR